jgi:hypothetical protein
MLVLLAGGRGSNQVRDDLCKIAVVLGPVRVDRLLDVSPLLRCASSALFDVA